MFTQTTTRLLKISSALASVLPFTHIFENRFLSQDKFMTVVIAMMPIKSKESSELQVESRGDGCEFQCSPLEQQMSIGDIKTR